MFKLVWTRTAFGLLWLLLLLFRVIVFGACWNYFLGWPLCGSRCCCYFSVLPGEFFVFLLQISQPNQFDSMFVAKVQVQNWIFFSTSQNTRLELTLFFLNKDEVDMFRSLDKTKFSGLRSERRNKFFCLGILFRFKNKSSIYHLKQRVEEND